MALSPPARTLCGVAIAFSILTLILLCVTSDGGAWEGFSFDAPQQGGGSLSIDLDFGLAHAKVSLFGMSQEVSYDDLYDMLTAQGLGSGPIVDDFNKLRNGGKAISAMIGLAVTSGVLNLVFLILMLVDKAPKLHKLAPIFGSMLALFAALPFVLWIALPHEGLRDFSSQIASESGNHDTPSLHWCFALSIVAFVSALVTMFLTLRARNAALDTADATPYAMPVGGAYVPPTGVAYQPLQDPNAYNPYGANPYGANPNGYSNTSQPN